MGIREMLDEIRMEATSSAEKKIENAKVKANNMILSKINELENFYAGERLALESEISSLKKRIKGKAEIEIERERQEKKANLYRSFINEILTDVISEIKKNKEKYANLILSVVRNAKKELKNKKVEVVISYEDEAIVSEIKKEFENTGKISFSNISGGIILKTEDTYIDASFDNMFEKLRPQILKIVVEEIGD